MNIHIDVDGNTLRLNGELTIYTVAQTKAALAAAPGGTEAIEVDLSGISEMDSAGLQLLLIAKRHPGREVRFVNHPPLVLRLIDLARLGGVLGDPLVISGRQEA